MTWAGPLRIRRPDGSIWWQPAYTPEELREVRVGSERCRGTTGMGDRCQRLAIRGRGHCQSHLPKGLRPDPRAGGL